MGLSCLWPGHNEGVGGFGMTIPRLSGCVWWDGESTHVCASTVEEHERCVCANCGFGFVCVAASEHIERRRKLANTKKGGRP